MLAAGQLKICAGILIAFAAAGVSTVTSGEDAPLHPDPVICDTIKTSADPRESRDLARTNDWKTIHTDRRQTVKGDAVIFNNRMALALRRHGRGAELYARKGRSFVLRATLFPLNSDAAKFQELQEIETDADGTSNACIRARYSGTGGTEGEIIFTVQSDRQFTEARHGKGVDKLRVETGCDYMILPDQDASGIILDSESIPENRTDLPAGNILMHMIGKGESIVMCAATADGYEQQLTLAGCGTRRRFTASEMDFGRQRTRPSGRLVVAVIEVEDIWHRKELDAADAGRIVRTGWQPPFQARWRVDLMRHSGVTESWEIVQEQKDGTYIKNDWLGGAPGRIPATREFAAAGTASCKYPAWMDREKNIRLQPPVREGDACEGPAFIYAAERTGATPPGILCVADMIREIEPSGQQHRPRNNSPNRDLQETLPAISKLVTEGKHSTSSAEFEKLLAGVLASLNDGHSRISAYAGFGTEAGRLINVYVNSLEQERLPPLLEMAAMAKQIGARMDARKDSIRTPEYSATLVNDFRKNLSAPGQTDSKALAEQFTDAAGTIAANQDQLAGELRTLVLTLHQKAALLLLQNTRYGPVARELRVRTKRILAEDRRQE